MMLIAAFFVMAAAFASSQPQTGVMGAHGVVFVYANKTSTSQL